MNLCSSGVIIDLGPDLVSCLVWAIAVRVFFSSNETRIPRRLMIEPVECIGGLPVLPCSVHLVSPVAEACRGGCSKEEVLLAPNPAKILKVGEPEPKPRDHLNFVELPEPLLIELVGRFDQPTYHCFFPTRPKLEKS